MNKDVKKFVQSIAHIPGVTVEQSPSGGNPHLRVLKDGKLVTTIPSTPSDHRWERNARSSLRLKGITPAVKPKRAEVVLDPAAEVEEIRAQFAAMRTRRGETAAFSRFVVDEVGPMLGIRTFATTSSSEVSIARFVKGGNLESWAFLAVTEGLRLWVAKQASVSRTNGQTVVEEPPMPPRVEPPSIDLGPDPATVNLTVDLDRLNEILGLVGIRVTL